MSIPFLKEAFEIFSEGHGYVDIQTAALLTTALGFSHSTTDEIDAMVRSMDTSCTGRITVEQMDRFLSKGQFEKNGAEEMWRAFTLIDTSSTGQITPPKMLNAAGCDREINPKKLKTVCELFGSEDKKIPFETWRMLLTAYEL